MNAIARDSTAILLTTRASPTAEALDDDVYLTLPVFAPGCAHSADVGVFLPIEFARRLIDELQRAVETAAAAGL